MDSDEQPLSSKQIDALVEDVLDLKSQVEAYKWRPKDVTINLSQFVKELRNQARENTRDFFEGFLYDKKSLSGVVFNLLFKNYTDAQIVGEKSDMFVMLDLRARSLLVVPIEENDLSDYTVSFEELLETKQRVVLLSTLDIVYLNSFAQTLRSSTKKTKLEAYHQRNVSLLAASDGTMNYLEQLNLTAKSVPIAKYFKNLRTNAVVQGLSSNSKLLGFVMQREPFAFAEAEAEDGDFQTIEQVDLAIEKYKKDGVLFVLIMRDDYGRMRGWLPARLTWAGDSRESPAVVKRRIRRRRTVRKEPQPAGVDDDNPDVEIVQEFGLFERGLHQNQLLFNKLYRKHVPYVNSAEFVSGEILRLFVIGYQLAFQNRSLDEILTPLSGTTSSGENVYATRLKPTLQTSKIDTSKPLNRDKATLAKLDSLLSTFVMFFDENDTEPVTPYLNEQRDGKELEVQKTFYPFLLDFVWRYFLQPFGPMTRKEERLRAVLKSRYIGAIANEDAPLFSYYYIKMAAGTAEERFNTATDLLQAVVRQYVQSGRMYQAPEGTPVDDEIEFTRDFERAHEYAMSVQNPLVPRKLAELFEMLGQSSFVQYGEVSLQDHLLSLTGSSMGAVTVYYSLDDGLYIGSDPVTKEQLKARVFSFNPKNVEATPKTSENDDDDEVPEETTPQMLTDYKLRDPIKFATSFPNLNKK